MMTIRSIKDYTTKALASYYPSDEAEYIAKLLLEAAYEKAYPILAISPPKDTQIQEGKKVIEDWTRRLLRHEPLQYVLGHTYFDGLRLIVSPGVLIPRPETEYLCALIRERWNPPTPSPTPLRGIDICTGSGCIALSLAQSFSHLEVQALEWSDQALKTFRKNVSAHPHLSDRIHLTKADLLSPKHLPTHTQYHLIVSNPPYVLESESEAMRPHVLDHEPDMALFVPDDDPLRFYNIILQKYAPRLARGGLLAFEINQHFGSETQSLCRMYGLDASICHDQYGRDRFIFATPQTL